MIKENEGASPQEPNPDPDVVAELQLRVSDANSWSKRRRLQDFDYIGCHAYHVVMVTDLRRPFFEDERALIDASDCLRSAARATAFRLLAYCFLKDHVHLLALGTKDDSNLIRLVQRFKQSTSYAFKQLTGQSLWQRSFFERILRADEDTHAVAAYIFQNPVRKGLTDDAANYPWSGGEFWDACFKNGAEAPPLLHDTMA